MPRKKEISASDLLAILDLAMEASHLELPDYIFDFDSSDIDLSALPPPLASVLGKKPVPHAMTLPVSGTHPINIRVPARVVRAFKLRALATGTSYQTLMNRAMAAAAKDFV